MRSPIFRTGGLPKARVEAFSDGVLAIVITLLVIEFHVPAGVVGDEALAGALLHLLPLAAAWAVSFVFVLTFWVSHHYFFSSLARCDKGLLWLNGLFLMAITLLPFATGLVGEYPSGRIPVIVLSAVMLVASLSFALMRYYALHYAKLLRPEAAASHGTMVWVQSAGAPLAYALAIVFGFIWTPAAYVIQALVLVAYVARSPSQSASAHDEIDASLESSSSGS